jgi:hypothetical protein
MIFKQLLNNYNMCEKDFKELKIQFELLQKQYQLLLDRVKSLETYTSDKFLEKDYQNLLSKLIGKSHCKNTYGITDITTHNSHIEIKNWYNYKNCLGQLQSYNQGHPKEFLIAAFFGKVIKKKEIIELMHINKIDVWELNIIDNELIIEKYPYIPKDIQLFIEKHLIKTSNENDVIKLSDLQKYNIDTKFIPLIGYKLTNTYELDEINNKIKIKEILLQKFKISESKDFVKLKDVKEELKKSGVVENNVITLKNIIEDIFEGVEFRDRVEIDKKSYRNIILKLNIK